MCPGYGLSPDNYFKIIGRRAKNIRMFEQLKKFSLLIFMFLLVIGEI